MKAAGTVFFMAAKLNETQKICMQFIVEWSHFQITRENIINTEFEILEGFNYSLPVVETR
jgi:hypothetical protein